jgi:hypothetical protein
VVHARIVGRFVRLEPCRRVLATADWEPDLVRDDLRAYAP